MPTYSWLSPTISLWRRSFVKILDGQKGKRCSEEEYLAYTHKRCAGCNTVKAVSLFYRKNTRTTRGWAWDSHCIECRRSACKEYGASNRSQRNARLMAWRKKNPSTARARDRRARLKAKYGLSEVELNAMRKEQGGCCAICKKRSSKLLVDHDHVTGKVRALLCQTCNTFLGWYENKADIILQFQEYVARHS